MRADTRFSTLTLRSTLHHGMVLGALGCIFIIALMMTVHYHTVWPLGIISLIELSVMYRFLVKSRSTLTLSFGGFSINDTERQISFKWTDVEQFTVLGRWPRKHVAFSLSPLGKDRCSTRTVFLARAEVSGFNTVFRLPQYESQTAEKLQFLLVKWHAQGRKIPN